VSSHDAPSPERVLTILCVCTGNSCRSVMAQGLLRHFLNDRSDIHVFSAGLGTLGGLGPTPETVAVMAREGIDVSQHLSQPATADLVRQADLILVMDQSHRDSILRKDPAAEPKVFLLKEFLAAEPVGDPNIPDPIGGPLEVYETCLITIRGAVRRVAEWLRGSRPSRSP